MAEARDSFSLHGHEFARFAAVKKLCDPGGLTPADTEAIELITGADKSQEPISKLSKLFSKLPANDKGVRRDPPRLFVEEATFRQGGANGFRTLRLLHIHAKIFKAILTNSSAPSGHGGLCQALLDCLVGFQLLVTERDQGEHRVVHSLIAFTRARWPHSPLPTLRPPRLCPSAQERLVQPSFLPTPLMREIAAISPETTAALNTSTAMPLRIARRELRSHAGDMIQQEPEQVALCQSAKAIEGLGIFTHHQVGKDFYRGTRIGKPLKT